MAGKREKRNAKVASASWARHLTDYLRAYIAAYRNEFERATAHPPKGGGFPVLPISPYLEKRDFKVLIAKTGVIVFLDDREPDGEWFMTEGPAILVDREPSVVPEEFQSMRKTAGTIGRPSKEIYRIVVDDCLPQHIWDGNLPVEYWHQKLSDGSSISVFTTHLGIEDASALLSYGALGRTLDLHLDIQVDAFWEPAIYSHIGMVRADRQKKRFFDHLEIHAHKSMAAWEPRSVWARAASDVRRDFLRHLPQNESGNPAFLGFTRGDTRSHFTMGGSRHHGWVGTQDGILQKLRVSIEELRDLLVFQKDATEDVFHSFLLENSVLFDVYGTIVNKPRFRYPEGQLSPVGKAFVEPDFIIKYQNSTYKLVELERASKRLGTRSGHPRQDLGQAAFQIAEWKDYIAQHYDQLRDKFPGISEKSPSLVVLSMDSINDCADQAELNRKISLYKRQFSVDEIWTYHDVLRNAEMLYTRLSALGATENIERS